MSSHPYFDKDRVCSKSGIPLMAFSIGTVILFSISKADNPPEKELI